LKKKRKTLYLACCRCRKGIVTEKMDGVTAGYYDMSNGYWSKYAKNGERILCDHCMQSDPAYKRNFTGFGSRKPPPPKAASEASACHGG
jgi:hypothetical protein